MEQIVAKIKGKIVVKFRSAPKLQGEMFQRWSFKRFKKNETNLNRLII
ncbi:hypothetical protein [Rhizobium bangladeshense]|nr:hypothetical protein [Rhizobium bangladeshense]MBX4897614.1 hypothetical protein [Rhizobium bangladeshense]